MTVNPFTYSSPHSLTYSFLCFFVSPQEWTSFKHHHLFFKTYESKDEKSISIFPKDSIWTENTWYKQKPKMCNMVNAQIEIKMIKSNETEWGTQLSWVLAGGVCVEGETGGWKAEWKASCHSKPHWGISIWICLKVCASLLTVPRHGMSLRPLTDEWVKKLRYIRTIE